MDKRTIGAIVISVLIALAIIYIVSALSGGQTTAQAVSSTGMVGGC